jgi:hypothetical protein
MERYIATFKLSLSIVVALAGIFEWAEAEEFFTALELHHGIVIIGLINFVESSYKLYTLRKLNQDNH